MLQTEEILALRPQIQRPLPGTTPLETFREIEASDSAGNPVDVLTVLLRGSECTFRCLMCDLWKSTHRAPTSIGAIASQVELATRSAEKARWIKLYNASNFFSSVNVPTQDLPAIAAHVRQFERIVVENHPRILNPSIERFRDSLSGELEIAMGLETVEPKVLRSLNKQMTVDQFRHACDWLIQRGISIRSFVLLRPPQMNEAEGLHWCSKSLEFCKSVGVRHVSVIPVRGGNGALEHLETLNKFSPPQAASLESVLALYLDDPELVVTVDLWDWERLPGHCEQCSPTRRRRLEQMNVSQSSVAPPNKVCNCSLGG